MVYQNKKHRISGAFCFFAFDCHSQSFEVLLLKLLCAILILSLWRNFVLFWRMQCSNMKCMFILVHQVAVERADKNYNDNKIR